MSQWQEKVTVKKKASGNNLASDHRFPLALVCVTGGFARKIDTDD
jgi:hypothetical protein